MTRVRALVALALAACGDVEPAGPYYSEALARAPYLAVEQTLAGVPDLVSPAPIRALRAADDVDRDGLSDTWEDAVLATVRPILLLHAGDGMFRDPDAVLALVGRVAPVGDDILVTITIAYSLDYGRCDGDRHPGDSERVAIQLARDPMRPDRVVTPNRWYTAAHEYTSYDRKQSGWFAELGPPGPDAGRDPATGDLPLWAVYVARDKHASYVSLEACAGNRVACLDDVCADWSTVVPLALVPWNAGEPGAPRLDALDEVGFSGECVWCGSKFCGGRKTTGCASPLIDKLLPDPFVL
jgi:hypothetical protein